MTLLRPFSSKPPVPPVAVPGPMTAVVDAPAPPSTQVLPNGGSLHPPVPSGPVVPPEPEAETPEPSAPTWRRFVRPVLLGLVLMLLGGVIASWLASGEEAATPEQIDAAISDALASTTVPEPIGPAIYNTVLPSLTLIRTGEPGSPGSSTGSGVIINADGNILTSLHVVDGAESISVTFADGTESTGQIVQADPAIDIAVLATDRLPEVVVPAVLGGGVRIGQPVFALGNPLGLGGSFSAGVVSGLERTLPVEDGLELSGLIQFDAAVNPGSSGGPLIDGNGQVVGVVTALANPTGEDFFSGIGFAVPIATAGGAAGGPEQ